MMEWFKKNRTDAKVENTIKLLNDSICSYKHGLSEANKKYRKSNSERLKKEYLNKIHECKYSIAAYENVIKLLKGE